MLIATPPSEIGALVPFCRCSVTRTAGPAMLPGPLALPWMPSILLIEAVTPLLSAAGEFSGTGASAVGGSLTLPVGPVGVGVGSGGGTLVSVAARADELAAADVPA